jgi:hypothetical protein
MSERRFPPVHRPSAGPLEGHLARLRDRRGIIVLGPLIIFVIVLIIMVVAGKIFYPAPRGTYRTEPVPELSYALAPAEVHSGDRVAMRLQPGDSVWIVRLDNGSAVVFRDGAGREVVGVTSGLLGTERPRG